MNEQSAQNKQPIKTGDSIITGADGLAILALDGGSKIRIDANSELTLKAIQHEQQGSLLSLLRGSIISHVKKLEKPEDKLTVQTRNAAMAVRGTRFFVGLKESDVWMCVEEGSVAVKGHQDQETYIVNPGEGVVIPAAGKSSAPAFFPWTKKIDWETNEGDKVQINQDVLEQAYENPLDHFYD